MEQVKEQKHSKLKKGLATALALITVSTTIFGALSIFKPKNVVFAEEVQAQVSNVTSESVTIQVNTYPIETVYKEFTVNIEAVNGNTTQADANVTKCLSYKIAEDYSAVTVTCKEAFNGRAKLTVTNVKDPSIYDTCYFRYQKDLLQKNYTLIFQRYEGSIPDRQFIEDECFYMDGANYYESRDLDHGISNGDWYTRPKENGFAPLYYDGQYYMKSQEHLFGKGDQNNNNKYYWHFIKNETVLASLNSYAAENPTQYGVPVFSFVDSYFDTNKRSFDFNISKMLIFTHDGYKYQINAYLNVLFNWMHENPEMALIYICHDDVETRAQVLAGTSEKELEYSNFYNKYFYHGTMPTSVELGQSDYTFNV